MKVMKITIPKLNADRPGMLDSKKLKKLNDFKISLQASCIINSIRGFAEDITRHKRWLTDKLDSGKNVFEGFGFKLILFLPSLFVCFVVLLIYTERNFHFLSKQVKDFFYSKIRTTADFR